MYKSCTNNCTNRYVVLHAELCTRNTHSSNFLLRCVHVHVMQTLYITYMYIVDHYRLCPIVDVDVMVILYNVHVQCIHPSP